MATFEDDEDAMPGMVDDVPAISLQRGSHLHGSVGLSPSSFGCGTKQPGEVVVATGWEVESLRARESLAAIHDGRHLQRRLGAIEERVVDLAVEIVGRELLFGEALQDSARPADEATAMDGSKHTQ